MFVLTRRVVIPDAATEFGITFSPRTASYYGVDPRAAYTAALDELDVRLVRLPVYWDDVEPSDDAYAFTDTDWYMDEAAARGAKVTLVIGMKVPRWPECHVPDWVPSDAPREALLDYLEAAVVRYAHHPALYRWQVENEVRFPFGECPAPDLALFADEVALVRSLDADTPIQLTVSGEQEAWAATAEDADVLGASLYRFAWNSTFGLVVFPHPPSYYRLQWRTLGDRVDTAVISELQAEPWFDGDVPADVAERYALFPEERLRDHARFAEATEFPEVYLWGAEWWYALRIAGEPRLWDTARDILQE
ncbi:hypothetical protein HYS28_02720 [Candidatus Uhrbacteria bacterium]|nr:hypothetical protein [Candidatus Uhrbacteria bacterium]